MLQEIEGLFIPKRIINRDIIIPKEIGQEIRRKK